MTRTPAPVNQKRTVRSRASNDAELISLVGMFPLISPAEVAELMTRPDRTVRHQFQMLRDSGHMGSVDAPPEHLSFFEEIKCKKCGTPNLVERRSGRTRPPAALHFLTPKGEELVVDYGVSVAAAWPSKSSFMVPHDRALTVIHLAFHNQFGQRVAAWSQRREDVKESVLIGHDRINFLPDSKFTFDGAPAWLEYTRANPSSEDGESDVMKKIPHYNALLKTIKNGRVFFVFERASHVMGFLNKVADAGYPYRWCWATDIESLKHDPAGNIWWTAKDFDTRKHGLIEQAA